MCFQGLAVSEDSDLEKTEPASPRRLEKSRDEGQVPRSPELSTFVVLIAGGAGLWLMGGHLSRQLLNLMKDGMKVSRETGFDSGLLTERLFDQSLHALLTFAPFLILMFLVALAAQVLLSGWPFTWKSLTPDLKRLSPLKGIGRMFSSTRLAELANPPLQAPLIGSMSALTICRHTDAPLALIPAPLTRSAGPIREL